VFPSRLRECCCRMGELLFREATMAWEEVTTDPVGIVLLPGRSMPWLVQ